MFVINIWFKGYRKNKIQLSKSFVFPKDATVFDIISKCCGQEDLPTPVILDKHNKYFNEFSLVRFSKDDFVETIPYDYVEIELFEE